MTLQPSYPLTEEFLSFLASCGGSLEAIPSFMNDCLDYYFSPENTREMLALLATASGEGKDRFFSNVASSPNTEQGWDTFQIIAANLNDADADRLKIRWRHCVELVRGATGDVI